ncbi:MAG TPA: glycosyltransferase [Solirubrobacteraceae bacterium]
MPAPDVAIVSPYPRSGARHGGPSGVASYTVALAHALSDAGAQVEVLAPAEPGAPAVTADGAVTVRRPFARGARALGTALRAARATGAPTVHLQHETFLYGGAASVPGLVPALGAMRRSPARTVVTMHHVVDGPVDAAFTHLHRVAAPPILARAGLQGVRTAIRRLADRVIVHEPAFARAIPGAAVVPHGVELPGQLSRAEARARLGIEEDRLTVLCFGFLAPYKGLDPALAAAAILGDAVRLVVAGGEHPRLAQAGDGYAAGLRAANPHARFTGFVPDADVAAWFAATDLALFHYPRPVSTSGGLALAFAHRTPVLLSEELAGTVGAPRALVAPREPRALAAQLAGIAAGAPRSLNALRAEVEHLGRGRSWPAVARRHLEIYAGAA